MVELPTRPQKTDANFMSKCRNGLSQTNSKNLITKGINCLEFTHNTISPTQDAVNNNVDNFTTPVNTRKKSTDDNYPIKTLLNKQIELEARIADLEKKLSISEAKNSTVSELTKKVKYLETKIVALETKAEVPIKQKISSTKSIEKSIQPGQGKKFLLTNLLKNFQMKSDSKNKFKNKSKQI